MGTSREGFNGVSAQSASRAGNGVGASLQEPGVALCHGLPDGRCGSYIGAVHRESDMARTASAQGKDETKTAEKKVKASDKPAGARGGITAPVTPSPELAEIVGKDDLPRSEVVKKVWEYIKKHELQDEKDKRNINADARLEKIFGKKQSSMFEMNKYLSAHVTAVKG